MSHSTSTGTPPRGRTDQVPAPPATVGSTIRAAVAAIVSPARFVADRLGLISSGGSADSMVQQLDFGSTPVGDDGAPRSPAPSFGAPGGDDGAPRLSAPSFGAPGGDDGAPRLSAPSFGAPVGDDFVPRLSDAVAPVGDRLCADEGTPAPPAYLADLMKVLDELNNSVAKVSELNEGLDARLRLMEEERDSSGVYLSDDLLDGGVDAPFAADSDEVVFGCVGCSTDFSASGGDGVPGVGWTTVSSKKERRESSKSVPSIASSSTGSTSTGPSLNDTHVVAVGTGANCASFQFYSDEAADLHAQSGISGALFTTDAFGVQYPKDLRPSKSDTKNFVEFQAKITKPLTELFGAASYAATRSDSANFKGGSTGADIAEITIEKLTEVSNHCIKFDLTFIINVPPILPGVDTDMSDDQLKTTHPRDLFDLSGEGLFINLVNEWGLLDLKRILFWQRYLNVNNYVTLADRDSNGYLWLFLFNSMVRDLRNEVMGTLKTSFAATTSCTGGATLLYALIQASFGNSRSVFESYAQRITDFESTGLKRSEGENVVVKAKSLLQIVHCLYFAKYLHSRMVDQLLAGFQLCSCPEFSDFFLQLARDRLKKDMTSTLDNVLSDARPATQFELYTEIKSLLNTALRLYIGLNERGRWHAKGKNLRYNVAGSSGSGGNGGSSRELICGNCNGPHKLAACPLERNESRLNKQREELRALVKAEGGKVDKAGRIFGVKKAFWEKKHAIDAARKKKEGVLTGPPKVPLRDKSGNTPVSHRFNKGTIEFQCTECPSKKRWGNHPTDLHDLAESQGASFDIVKEKPDDPVVRALAALRNQKSGGSGGASSASGAGSGGAKLSKDEWAKKMAAVTELIESKEPGSEEHKAAMNTFRLLSAKVKDF